MRILMMFIVTLSSVISSAQGVLEREHPRVSELQDKMTDYARSYLQTRLQGVPFMVTIKIDPLRRQTGADYKPQNEKMPYYDLSEVEIRDEWDDPSASLYVLQSRIQKATVMISLPKALKDEEVQEIKDSLMTLLRLIPGRDEIKIEQRNWSLGATFWNYSILAVGVLVLFLFGLLFISRTGARRLANAIHEIKPKEKVDGENSSTAMTPVYTNGSGLNGASGGLSANAGGDLKFRDPLKTREFVSGRVAELSRHSDFPNLQAMIEIDRLADRCPKDLGALLMEFPLAKQKELFSLSYKASWLNAFTNPGELTGESLELLDHLCRIQYEANTKEWELLLIQVWRLGPERANFVKNIKKDDAFAILKSMPSSVAVPAARQAFPGAWAVLLDTDFKPSGIPSTRVKEIYSHALEKKPLNDFGALERYRQEKDLLSYLLISSLPEEKDIYGALPKNSFFWQARPPFYSVLEQEEVVLKKVFERVSIDDWALALFNVSREFRKSVDNLFNAKQKYLFMSKMRTLDQANLDKAVMGAARERIGRVFYNITQDESQMNEQNANENSGDSEGQHSDENAA